MARREKIDKVRASRDGHEFHEAWAARRAMQLLWPDTDLIAIAVEGPSPEDQAGAAATTIEIADLVFYYGGDPNFEDAARTTYAQFKYSIADKDKDFRASHAKKTVEKFAATYRFLKRKYGAEAVEKKLDFQLVTNQPIADALIKAIEATAAEATCKGDIEKQAKQFRTASGLTGKPLAAFARKFKLIGRSGSLPETKNELASLLVDWSATSDPIARARLGKLQELVRDKAGYAGTNRNLIRRTDVLAALQIDDPEDLLPCNAALIEVGKVLEREQLGDAISQIAGMSAPILIHATGGVGKTVFMDTLASKIGSDHEVVFFDCFGGGAYRSPEDARHLPKRGLIHIANTLAFRGLCDPMLPGSPDVQNLFSTFRRRLQQCVNTISRMTPGRHLAIFIDAVDNAVYAAGQTSEDCFPIKLLESLDTQPIDGVKLIVSCRTERKPHTYAKFEEFPLSAFSKNETAAFLRARLKNVTTAEINVAQARSGGNPRILDYLLKSGRGLLDVSEINKKIELDDLIQQKITDALSLATTHGYEEKDLSAFLAGLAVLPPPVPVDEYAAAHGMDVAAIESFASDLSPLLERTNHGIMFRDEPTETLIHKRYATSREALERVAANLNARQDASVYAARALPRLLHELDAGEQLFALAFDDRVPASITSTVGKRNIQYARLKAATLHAAIKSDYNSLTRLLVELSTIAAVDQRGADYLLDHPELIVAAQDTDARRRLFEIRTAWPGSRHARLAIVNALSGQAEEAYRHAYANEEWVRHYRRTKRQEFDREPRPDRTDIAASSFFLLSQRRTQDAADYLTGWLDWYAFELCELVFRYAHLGQSIGTLPARRAGDFVNALSGIGPLAAALSFHDTTGEKRKSLCKRLASLCKKETKLDLPQSYSRRRTYEIEDGLRKSAALALSLGLTTEAQSISLRARHARPGVWSFRDGFNHTDVFSYVFRVALLAAAKDQPIHEKDLLPHDLVKLCAPIPKSTTGAEFRKKALDRLSKVPKKPRYEDDRKKKASPNAKSQDELQAAERFFKIRLEPLLLLAEALAAALGASARTIDKRFAELITSWEDVRKNRDQYRTDTIDHFFHLLGLDGVLFVLWTRSDLKPSSIERFLSTFHAHMPTAPVLVQIVAILAQRPPMESIAGEQAIKARAMVGREDEVNYRAKLFGNLGRAMLPASIDDASVFFRDGLEQMDAIGSGDYEFTNELLLFASGIKGEELEERNFHTLSNICELNLTDEAEKFYWGAYGRGMAKAAGVRGLAKLSRWDDRNRIPLKNTLLPYLTGLLEAGKIDPIDALCINRLANSVEYHFAGTEEFAKALREQAGPDAAVITELVTQYEDDNPAIAGDNTVVALCILAEESLGKSHELAKHLKAARDRYEIARQGRNTAYASSSDPDPKMHAAAARRGRENKKALERIAAATDPTDEAALAKAIDAFNALGNMYDHKSGFFAALRDKVPLRKRGLYIRNIAALEHLFFYWKFAELKEAREAWAGSSAALEDVYKSLAKPLILAHADDLVDHGRFSGSNIKEISEFTGISMAELVLEVTQIYSRPDSNVAGAVWLACANFICPEADEGEGQIALKRLLASESARLSDNVTDGPWKEGCYPSSDFTEVAAGLIWRMLGSPHAVDRWRAAHCMRRFARFKRWEVLDRVVAGLNKTTAASFQAPELSFYYMHARLWLLIALARVAIDFPAHIARYKDELLAVVLEKEKPHVLMRHFAAKALLSCVSAGKLTLDARTLSTAQKIDLSLYARSKKKRSGGGFYQGRPDSVPEPAFRFHLEYDFKKHDVDSLARVFGKGCWEVDDMISGIVQGVDPSTTHMYEDGGRESRRQNSYGITTDFHNYGQQLGWHAMFMAAGELLAAHPVIDEEWYEDPWTDWLGGYALSRQDGLWLSDGTDRTPDDAAVRLLESNKKKILAITGDQKKIMELARLDVEKGIGKELVIEGRWRSSDGISIGLSSALVPPDKAARFARKLVRDKPAVAWIPIFQGGEEDTEYLHGEKKGYAPWIVCPHGEARLDEHDPYGVSDANFRPRLARDYAAYCKLSRQDEFGRVWLNNRGTICLRAQAWGRAETNREDGPHLGHRLLCKSSILKKVLTKYDNELLLLFDLRRYEKETYRHSGRYSYSIAVVRIDRELNVEYFKGRVNYLDKSLW